MIDKFREDMCNLTLDLPLARNEWRTRKFNPETQQFEVTAMCPLCTLAVKQNLLTINEVNRSGDIGEEVYNAIANKYEVGMEDLSLFVVKWDSRYGSGLTVEEACSVIDQIVEEANEPSEMDNEP